MLILQNKPVSETTDIFLAAVAIHWKTWEDAELPCFDRFTFQLTEEVYERQGQKLKHTRIDQSTKKATAGLVCQ